MRKKRSNVRFLIELSGYSMDVKWFLKQICFQISLSLVVFFAVAVITEAFLTFTNKEEDIYLMDSHLGWKLVPSTFVTKMGSDFAGREYPVVHKTNSLGLRAAGADNSDLTFLVLGDSFTADPTASNNQMWFATFAQQLESVTGRKIRVFAGGGGGYGTYQNLLLLESLMPALKFDALILQFCENDYQNNSLLNAVNSIVKNDDVAFS